MKAVKWIAIIGGGLIVLLALTMILVAAFVDPNEFKGEIAQAVKEQTGRDLRFGGDISLSVFPWLALEVGEVELSNAPGFGDKPFVRLDEADISIRLIPLLSKRFEMGDVSVKGLELNLMVNEQGTTNWDDLTGGDKDEPASQQDSDSSGGMDLRVGGLEVDGANISYDDRRKGERYVLKDVDISTGDLDPGDPFDFDISFGVDSAKPAISADLEFKGTATLDLDARVYEIADLTAEVEAEGADVPGGEAEATLTASDARVDMGGQSASLKSLSLTAYGVTIQGAARAERILDAPAGSAELTIEPFDLKKTLAALGQETPVTADDAAMTSLAARLSADFTKTGVSTKGAMLTLDDTTVTADVAVKDLDKTPYYGFTVAVDEIDADRYLPPKGEGESGGKAAGSGGPEQDVIPVELLRNLRMDGKLTIDKLTINGMHVTDVLVETSAKDGVVTVNPADLTLYEGKIKTQTAIDARPDAPKTAFKGVITDLMTGPMVRDMTGSESFSGRLNANAALTTTGAKVSAMKQRLNGNAAFRINDGVFPGVDLEEVAKAAAEKKDKSGDVAGTHSGNTKFGEISGTATITDGLVKNDDLEVKAPNIRCEGRGTANLVSERIDYRVLAKLVLEGKGQGGTASGDLYGIPVPIKLGGTFSEPTWGVDWVEYGKMIARGVTDLVGGAADSAVEGVKGTVKDLGGMLPGSSKDSKDAGAEDAPAEKKEGGAMDKLGKDLKSLF